MPWGVAMGYKYNEAAQIIKSSLKMGDVIERYVNDRPRLSRCQCPFHGGKDRNLLFSEWGYKCFVCGSHGDMIGFVQNLFDLNFADAVRKINDDFCLGIPTFGGTARQKKDMHKQYQRRMKEIADEKKKEEMRKSNYDRKLSEYVKFDRMMRECEPLSDDWVIAAKNVDRLFYELSELSGGEFIGRTG